MSKLGDTKEIFRFLIKRKNYWLIPLVIMLILMGLLIIFAEVTGLGPFIYPFI